MEKTDNLTSQFYESTLLIREVEQLIVDIYHTDVIKSPVHLSIGQEWVSTAICGALKSQDLISNTYRCHATYLAKNGDINAMMAELYGKVDGCARGKAGSMHLVDIERGILAASAVVGTTVPVSTGYALATKMDKVRDKVVVTVFGDGASEEGCFAESINFAALHKLPQIFVCENNGLAIHEPIEKRWSDMNICGRMENYGLKVFQVKSGDIFELFECMVEARDFALNPDNPPVFIEVMAYRWLEHVGIADDHNEEYRDIGAYSAAKENDQVTLLEKMLPEAEVVKIQMRVKKRINEAKSFAEQSPFPSVQELYQHVYA